MAPGANASVIDAVRRAREASRTWIIDLDARCVASDANASSLTGWMLNLTAVAERAAAEAAAADAAAWLVMVALSLSGGTANDCCGKLVTANRHS